MPTITPATPTEVQQNKRGKLSRRQRKALTGERGLVYKLIVSIMIVAITFSSVGWWGMLVVFSLGSTYFYFSVFRHLGAVLDKPQVKFVAGQLVTRASHDEDEEADEATGVVQYYLGVQSGFALREFVISRAVYRALPTTLPEGRIYYYGQEGYLFHETDVS